MTDWQLRIDTPVHLLAALYVRDAADLRPPGRQLPALAPPADRVEIDEDLRAAAAVQSPRWWQALVRSTALIARMRPAEALDGLPALAAVVEACGAAPTDYADARLREIAGPDPSNRWRDAPRAAVTAAEQELGRPVRAFCLTIEEMPLAQAGVWPIADQRFVTSLSFPADRARVHAWLTEAVLAVG